MTQDKSFIEVQFPVSKVSKESYKERKANLGQTLTGIGKWWGRKPLVLVRAAVLGLLMPASNDKKKDMEIFLKIMTMDQTGLLKRRNKSIPVKTVMNLLTPREQLQYFQCKDGIVQPKFKKKIIAQEKETAIAKAWNRMSYDEKLTYCLRPEEFDNRDQDDWKQINLHLGTQAVCLTELIDQLGCKRFGKRAVVGDCFCGGGSIPFEAARIGCDVYASDLNPIAGLLTWADLNIAGVSNQEVKKLQDFQKRVYSKVSEQINDWGIETNEQGDRANSYLYCNEIICPECGYKIPLSPSWVIGKGTKTVAILTDNGIDGFNIEIKSDVSEEELKTAEQQATVNKEGIYCPHCKPSKPIPLAAIRHDRRSGDGGIEYGLRRWGKNEFIPNANDIFQERLYCIKYEKRYLDINGNEKFFRYYVSPSDEDLQREKLVVALLNERFEDWQEKGYIPSSKIEEGDETSRLARERGWKYWHQLFNSRQLLVHGLFMKTIHQMSTKTSELIIGILGLNKCCDWNSKLSMWNSTPGVEKVVNTFSNQSLNTLFTYGTRAFSDLTNLWQINIKTNCTINTNSVIQLNDARKIETEADLWITDPPYADAVNYHELSEFFLGWDKQLLSNVLNNWYTDSKRVLAVRGKDESFNNSMIEVYSNLAEKMSDTGMQIIMFTHQDVNVWSDLTLIVWSAGLQVTAAWNIATETESGGLKDGNYVKGTVLLVLRKQTTEATAYLDDIYPDIEDEVKRQIRSMQELDEQEEPNFSDADYILAAYAASLKVLTSYKRIEDIDVQYELTKQRKAGELSPIARLIESAKKIAYDQLIPAEFDKFIWKTLTPEERLYIKGLELEKHNIYQLAAYQELARGFGVPGYKDLLASAKANTARFKTAAEFGNRNLNDDMGFGPTLLRQVLMALYLIQKEGNVQSGKNWLRNEITDYWDKRERIGELLQYLATLEHIDNMAHWHEAAASANILKELVANDGI
jgi:putative DNA methylase